MSPSSKLPVAILGATGAVGQRFVQLLANHPWFEIAVLTGSERSIGKPYAEVTRWILNEPIPPAIGTMIVQPTSDVADVPLAFGALPTENALEAEPQWAKGGVFVCSNASAFRMDPLVPLLIPEVNPQHLAILERQQRERGWPGAIVTNPNCATITIVMALKPLHDAFGVQRMFVTTLQAVSGAGYPGVASLDIMDNIIPNIGNGGEEDKIETEPLKLLGQIGDEAFQNAKIAISAQVTRVPVLDGHTAAVSLGLANKASPEEAAACMSEFRAPQIVRNLPSAPTQPIVVRAEADRPQPRRDRDLFGGMGTTVGRVRPCNLHDLKFVVLSHNTIRGAAGGAILNAELLVAEGRVG
ncbi:MAG: aspartate-semialdehyde dehydrogenase [Chloroflexi bacterium]|nr:MAG: aspartate-semialdehyde dehydrogenase [Chloroflexota bacterium]